MGNISDGVRSEGFIMGFHILQTCSRIFMRGRNSYFCKINTLINFNLPKQFLKIVMTYIGVAQNLTNSSFLKVEKPTKGRGWKEVSAILVVGEMGRIGQA